MENNNLSAVTVTSLSKEFIEKNKNNANYYTVNNPFNQFINICNIYNYDLEIKRETTFKQNNKDGE